MSLYLIILLSSVVIPFIFSFDSNLQFYKNWKYILPAIIIVAIFYIASDVIFTKAGVWGFNEIYHSGALILNLPLEEWLFFLLIPYACIFMHEVFVYYFPKTVLKAKTSKYVSIGLLIITASLAITNTNKSYTVYIFSLSAITMIYALVSKNNIIRRFYISFLIMLIPFTLVNGILTGSFISDEIVWYNNEENLGFRIGTIPIEDFFYAFTLVFINLIFYNFFKQKRKTNEVG